MYVKNVMYVNDVHTAVIALARRPAGQICGARAKFDWQIHDSILVAALRTIGQPKCMFTSVGIYLRIFICSISWLCVYVSFIWWRNPRPGEQRCFSDALLNINSLQ
jgi:hypothetical protein